MHARLRQLSRPGIGPAIVIALGIAFLAVSAVLVRADEQPIPLREGPGLAELSANCQGCHSLDYVRMNAPFISPDTWKAEIAKMRGAYGASIDDEDPGKILAYLTTNYGPPKE
jgi:mono/diheme cytochrome c family protein